MGGLLSLLLLWFRWSALADAAGGGAVAAPASLSPPAQSMDARAVEGLDARLAERAHLRDASDAAVRGLARVEQARLHAAPLRDVRTRAVVAGGAAVRAALVVARRAAVRAGRLVAVARPDAVRLVRSVARREAV